MNLEFLCTKLRAAGVTFAPGLTNTEVKRVEDQYGFMFPPDLNNFLTFALPISDRERHRMAYSRPFKSRWNNF